jgi:hypothetical protein
LYAPGFLYIIVNEILWARPIKRVTKVYAAYKLSKKLLEQNNGNGNEMEEQRQALIQSENDMDEEKRK